ncbi:MAG: dihydrolipoyl dehydrogenase family protein [Desulforhopalus sp.]
MVMGDMEMSTDLLVLGSGPAGYSAAIRGAELGLDVIMVDQTASPGGAWLRQSSIPLQLLNHIADRLTLARLAREEGIDLGKPVIDLEAVRRWKNERIGDIGKTLTRTAKRLGVLTIQAKAKFNSSTMVRLEGAELSRVRFKHAVVATGLCQPFPDYASPGADERIMTPAMALYLPDIPEQLLVVSDDCRGVELGTVYAALGSRVSLVTTKEILLPQVDRDLIAPLEKRLSELLEKIMLRTRLVAAVEEDGSVAVTFSPAAATPRTRYDRVIVDGDRYPNTADLGLENTDVTVDSGGFIACNERQQTADEQIFAAGEVAGTITQTHRAVREGRVAAEVAAGRNSIFDARAVPTVINTDPQIAWCGLTENEAERDNIRYLVQRTAWQDVYKAQITGQTEGLTKLLTEPEDGRILGAGIVGRNAGELIGEAVLAIEMGTLSEDLALTLHPCSTLSSTLAQAAESSHAQPFPSGKG